EDRRTPGAHRRKSRRANARIDPPANPLPAAPYAPDLPTTVRRNPVWPARQTLFVRPPAPPAPVAPTPPPPRHRPPPVPRPTAPPLAPPAPRRGPPPRSTRR